MEGILMCHLYISWVSKFSLSLPKSGELILYIVWVNVSKSGLLIIKVIFTTDSLPEQEAIIILVQAITLCV